MSFRPNLMLWGLVLVFGGMIFLQSWERRKVLQSDIPPPLTDATFQQVLNQTSRPVLIDLWAPWCGPCIKLAPHIKKIAQQYENQLDVYKINVDENPLARQYFNVEALPTLVLWEQGKEIDQIIGMRDYPSLEQWIRSNTQR